MKNHKKKKEKEQTNELCFELLEKNQNLSVMNDSFFFFVFFFLMFSFFWTSNEEKRKKKNRPTQSENRLGFRGELMEFNHSLV
jgi:hypothetical protein